MLLLGVHLQEDVELVFGHDGKPGLRLLNEVLLEEAELVFGGGDEPGGLLGVLLEQDAEFVFGDVDVVKRQPMLAKLEGGQYRRRPE